MSDLIFGKAPPSKLQRVSDDSEHEHREAFFLVRKIPKQNKSGLTKRSTQQNKWGLSYKVSGAVADFPQMKSSERKGKKSRFNSSSILAIMVINIVIITILNITLNARTK